jgi:ferredoxin-NADP reductase
MTTYIDHLLDGLTTYRLVLYYLLALVLSAILLGLFGLVPQEPTALTFSVVLLVAVCGLINWAFARVFAVPANSESAYITAIILALILDPVAVNDVNGIGGLIAAAVWAMASKYILALRHKHLFNPAALAVVLTSFLLDQPATWWVGGNLPLLPVVLAGGVLVLRKVRRFDLAACFMAVALLTELVPAAPGDYGMVLGETFRSSPLLFFAFVMLTEPLTSPARRLPRLAFAAIVGFLFAPDVHIGGFFFTPELALLIGNLFAFAVGPKGRLQLTLQRIEQTAADCYDFVFHSPRKLDFRAGQYLEWTLALPRTDSRGNRRYFTVASAPGEGSLRLGVKFYAASSAFKRALASMRPGDTIFASELAGDFTLPSNPKTKLAFLAGGIGVTPFRSMLRHLIDHNEARPIVMLYATERQEDIAYRELLDEAEERLGIRKVHAVARGARRGQYGGYIDEKLLRAAIPDFRERTFYVSGPQAMVKALRATLRGMGVRRSRIKVDFFPGFS